VAIPVITPHPEGQVERPGFYAMPARVYHADPCPAPSLSSSCANRLLDMTPKHAWTEHPRLGGLAGKAKKAKKEEVNIGSVAHELLLGEGAGIAILPGCYENFLTNAAKEARDEAIAAGKTPVLEKQYLRAERIAARMRAIVQEFEGYKAAFDAGAGGEIAAIWYDEVFGCWCRALIDWWGPKLNDLIDLKTTTVGLSDGAIDRKVESEGIDTQLMLYERGMSALWPQEAGRWKYRIAFIEQDEPYEARILALNKEQRDRGYRRMIHAGLLFGHCLARNEWPGYPRRVDETPTKEDFTGWPLSRWLDRERTDRKFDPIQHKLLLALSGQAPVARSAMDDDDFGGIPE
jgi:hypothetical protein